MARVEQLSIGTLDKKRDFFRKQVFHRHDFLELRGREFWEKCPGKMVQFLLIFPIKKSIATSVTEALLRQRLLIL
jgi:hypothetical protein